MLRRMGFRNLEIQAPKIGKTVQLVLNQLAGDPVLVVEHLGETNIAFWNDAIAKAQAKAGASQAGSRKKITADDIASMRVKNREILAKYSVRALENVFHDKPDGSPDPERPATADDIPAVVTSLPNDVFDTVWRFVQDANNFRDDPIVTADLPELAKK